MTYYDELVASFDDMLTRNHKQQVDAISHASKLVNTIREYFGANKLQISPCVRRESNPRFEAADVSDAITYRPNARRYGLPIALVFQSSGFQLVQVFDIEFDPTQPVMEYWMNGQYISDPRQADYVLCQELYNGVLQSNVDGHFLDPKTTLRIVAAIN
jgi:hypothetical protein